MKVLNLYAGIGGNRKLWNVSNLQIDAVEINPDIAAVYSDLFPNDRVIVGDAHQYLLDHFNEYDFIWTSPPCQTHTSFRQNICVRFRGSEPVYPDMKLYQEIIFLEYNAECKWVVENVIPYYAPLIPGRVLQRHMFWSNFILPVVQIDNENLRSVQIPELQEIHGVDLSKYQLENKRQILRNCVNPELGKAILDSAMRNQKQQTLMSSV